MPIFDIGVNVGYYPQKFTDHVGEQATWMPLISVHQWAVVDQPGQLLIESEHCSTSPTNKVAFGPISNLGVA